MNMAIRLNTNTLKITSIACYRVGVVVGSVPAVVPANLAPIFASKSSKIFVGFGGTSYFEVLASIFTSKTLSIFFNNHLCRAGAAMGSRGSDGGMVSNDVQGDDEVQGGDSVQDGKRGLAGDGPANSASTFASNIR